MSLPLATSPIFLAAAAFAIIGALFLLTSVVALLRLRLLRFVFHIVFGVACLVLGGAAATMMIGTQGYRALSQEEVAARVSVRPIGAQRFEATVYLPDNRAENFEIAGDEIYVDAHILKWNPWANLIGLHTAYELDRVAGRYRSAEDERSAPRTVHELRVGKPLDLFDLRHRFDWLAPVVDAEYGSATFVPVTAPAELEVRVSTSGLLIRKVGMESDPRQLSPRLPVPDANTPSPTANAVPA